MEKRMRFGKFIAIGCLAIFTGITIFHANWVAPQLDRKDKMSALVSAAHTIQAATIQHYALMPGANASNIDLERDYIDIGSLKNLVRLSEETGITTEIAFNKESFGNALSLSNFVLTGKSSPHILKITDLERLASQRRDNLIDSVPLWPWS
ncbi:MAG: Uncharacterized protein AWU57_937 [Marinobacter sp. T13-3]|nr:MAG: Uncharacterized protein AWU57_937 [Marinobacter sp. T13-3]